jgi:hypothetical protein
VVVAKLVVIQVDEAHVPHSRCLAVAVGIKRRIELALGETLDRREVQQPMLKRRAC